MACRPTEAVYPRGESRNAIASIRAVISLDNKMLAILARPGKSGACSNEHVRVAYRWRPYARSAQDCVAPKPRRRSTTKTARFYPRSKNVGAAIQALRRIVMRPLMLWRRPSPRPPARSRGETMPCSARGAPGGRRGSPEASGIAIGRPRTDQPPARHLTGR